MKSTTGRSRRIRVPSVRKGQTQVGVEAGWTPTNEGVRTAMKTLSEAPVGTTLHTRMEKDVRRLSF